MHLEQQGAKPRIVLLRDCMSPMSGFERLSDAFLQRARDWGAEVMGCAEAVALLG